MLVENNRILHQDEKPANIINDYFTKITAQLKRKSTKIDPKANLEIMINTFQNHKNRRLTRTFKLTSFILNLLLKLGMSAILK